MHAGAAASRLGVRQVAVHARLYEPSGHLGPGRHYQAVGVGGLRLSRKWRGAGEVSFGAPRNKERVQAPVEQQWLFNSLAAAQLAAASKLAMCMGARDQAPC